MTHHYPDWIFTTAKKKEKYWSSIKCSSILNENVRLYLHVIITTHKHCFGCWWVPAKVPEVWLYFIRRMYYSLMSQKDCQRQTVIINKLVCTNLTKIIRSQMPSCYISLPCQEWGIPFSFSTLQHQSSCKNMEVEWKEHRLWERKQDPKSLLCDLLPNTSLPNP